MKQENKATQWLIRSKTGSRPQDFALFPETNTGLQTRGFLPRLSSSPNLNLSRTLGVRHTCSRAGSRRFEPIMLLFILIILSSLDFWSQLPVNCTVCTVPLSPSSLITHLLLGPFIACLLPSFRSQWFDKAWFLQMCFSEVCANSSASRPPFDLSVDSQQVRAASHKIERPDEFPWMHSLSCIICANTALYEFRICCRSFVIDVTGDYKILGLLTCTGGAILLQLILLRSLVIAYLSGSNSDLYSWNLSASASASDSTSLVVRT